MTKKFIKMLILKFLKYCTPLYYILNNTEDPDADSWKRAFAWVDKDTGAWGADKFPPNTD